MRTANIINPGSGGRITDLPAHYLPRNAMADAQDAVLENGILTMRRGWAYENSTQVVAADLDGCWRGKITLTDEVVNLCTRGDGAGNTSYVYYTPDGSGSSTSVGTGQCLGAAGTRALPRAKYQDEVLICITDGMTPMLRWGGKKNTTDNVAGTGTCQFAAYEPSVITLGATTTIDLGAYIRHWHSTATNWNIVQHGRVISRHDPGDYRAVLSGFNFDDTSAASLVIGNTDETPIGYTFPCVVNYSDGACSVSSGTATGFGTEWDDTGHVLAASDCFALIDVDGSNVEPREIASVTDDDTLAVRDTGVTSSNKSPYWILRRCPFRDVAVHKGSLWGTGVKRFDNRVYVAPPGWNMSTPPNGLNSYDPAGDFDFDDPNDFLLDYIDVPGPLDGDPVEAILSTPGPLLVLKRKSCHGVYGKYPDFSQEMIDPDAGCIDLASAFESEIGAFWCGPKGIYCFKNNQLHELTAGKMNQEWRDLTAGFTGELNGDYCAAGEADGYLVVHITTDGGTTQKTFVCQIDRDYPANSKWISRWTNSNFRGMWSSHIPNEQDSLFAVGDDNQGYLVDLTPALDLSGNYNDADGGVPDLYYESPSVHTQSGSITNEHRLIDVQIAWNGYDASTPTTALDVDVAYWSGLRSTGTSPISLSNAAATTNNYVELYQAKANVSGRFHQLQIGTNTVDSSVSKVELHEISMSFRDAREAS